MEKDYCMSRFMDCCHVLKGPDPKRIQTDFDVEITLKLKQSEKFITHSKNVYFKVFLVGKDVWSEKRLIDLKEKENEYTWEEISDDRFGNFKIKLEGHSEKVLNLRCARYTPKIHPSTSLAIDIYQEQTSLTGETIVTRADSVTLNLLVLQRNKDLGEKRYALHNFNLTSSNKFPVMGWVYVEHFNCSKNDLETEKIPDLNEYGKVLNKIIRKEQDFINGKLLYHEGMGAVQVYSVGYRIGIIPRYFFYYSPRSKVSFTENWLKRQVKDGMFEYGLTKEQMSSLEENWYDILHVGLYAFSGFISYCLKYRSDKIEIEGERNLDIEAFQQSVFETGGFDCEDGTFGFVALVDYFLSSSYGKETWLKNLKIVLDQYCFVCVLGKAAAAQAGQTGRSQMEGIKRFSKGWDNHFKSWHDYVGVFSKEEFFGAIKTLKGEKWISMTPEQVTKVIEATSLSGKKYEIPEKAKGPFFVETTAPLHTDQINLHKMFNEEVYKKERIKKNKTDYETLWGKMGVKGSGFKIRILTERSQEGVSPSVYGRQSSYSYSGFFKHWEKLEGILDPSFRTSCFSVQMKRGKFKKIGVPPQIFFYEEYEEIRSTFSLIAHPAITDTDVEAFKNIDIFEQPPSVLKVCDVLKKVCKTDYKIPKITNFEDYPITIVLNHVRPENTKEELEKEIKNRLPWFEGTFLFKSCYMGYNVVVKLKLL